MWHDEVNIFIYFLKVLFGQGSHVIVVNFEELIGVVDNLVILVILIEKLVKDMNKTILYVSPPNTRNQAIIQTRRL